MKAIISICMRISLLAILLVLASACVGPDQEITAFIQTIKKQKKITQIIPLPELHQHKQILYQVAYLKCPFEFSDGSSYGKRGLGKKSPGSKTDRFKEKLELYPLESLEMVGFVDQQGQCSGIIKDTLGTLHIVKVGQYVGQNEGKILAIHMKGIDIQEKCASDADALEAKQILLSMSGQKEK